MPVLVLAFGLSQHLAQGTSLAAIVPTCVSGAASHARQDNVDLGIVLPLGAGGVVGAVGGAVAAVHIPSTPLRLLFAAYIAAVALRILWTLRRRPNGYRVAARRHGGRP